MACLCGAPDCPYCFPWRFARHGMRWVPLRGRTQREQRESEDADLENRIAEYHAQEGNADVSEGPHAG